MRQHMFCSTTVGVPGTVGKLIISAARYRRRNVLFYVTNFIVKREEIRVFSRNANYIHA